MPPTVIAPRRYTGPGVNLRMLLSSLALAFWLAGTAAVSAQEKPLAAKLATAARLDLLAAAEVGELRDARLVDTDGDVRRMNWLPGDDQPRSLTVEFPVSPLQWRPFTLQFTPTRTGPIALQLRGPWEQDAQQRLVRLEVFWDALQCTGATLQNGGFEQVTGAEPPRLEHWQGPPQVLVEATEPLPAVDGKRFVRTWHDAAVTQRLQGTAGQGITLRGHARAVWPEGMPPLKRNSRRDTPAHQAAKRFLRGVNLGNFLEVPPQEDWKVPHTLADLQQIRQEGFDHVRVPIGWHHYTGPAPDYRISDTIWRQVDRIVEEAQRLGLATILNLHHFDSFTSDPAKERARFLAIWRQVAEHYASEAETLAFELLNEPKDAATTEVMNSVYAETIKLIRKISPARTIFVGPGEWNSSEELFTLRLPDDDWNLIVTVHSYAPMYFTHQGASWTGADFVVTGIKFPGPPADPLPLPKGLQPYVVDWMERYQRLPSAENPSSPRALKETVQRIDEWSAFFGRPVHLGEFGVYNKADPESRANYYRAYRKQLEEHGIGWAIWDWKAGFRYWNPYRKEPEPGMREAIFEE